MDSKVWKLGICVLVAGVLLLLPAPAGLSPAAWKLFAMYLAALFGLVLPPFDEAVILLAVIAMRNDPPSKIAHTIASHAKEGEETLRSPEAVVINKVDLFNFESLKSHRGMIWGNESKGPASSKHDFDISGSPSGIILRQPH
jgi:hypothetical protein